MISEAKFLRKHFLNHIYRKRFVQN